MLSFHFLLFLKKEGERERDGMHARLRYDKGTVLIEGDVVVPFAIFDPRRNCYRALAFKHRDIIEFLENSGIEYDDFVLEPVPCPVFDAFAAEIKLREYQREAVQRWFKAGKRGCVVLPTGAGKTFVALEIIRRLSVATLVVVPTLDLVDQWRERLSIFGDAFVGEFSGRAKELKPLTVATYDSAYTNAETLGNKFMLLVFDEVHHLPAEAYRHIAELNAAPFRLGLTATFEREDGLHELLPELVGGKVFEMHPEELAGKHLANYELRRIFVPLSEEERNAYEHFASIFKEYVRKRRLVLRSIEDFQKVVLATGYDKSAYEALRAWENARKIAFNSENKMKKLKEILEMHRNDKIIIFTRHNELVYKISKRFLIPAITHKTHKDERREVLKGFKDGIFRAIVSSQVLDEGIDVPDANIGVVMSGTGSVREYIQRLGRILRPKNGVAILYEIISKETSEVQTARRRRKSSRAKPNTH